MTPFGVLAAARPLAPLAHPFDRVSATRGDAPSDTLRPGSLDGSPPANAGPIETASGGDRDPLVEGLLLDQVRRGDASALGRLFALVSDNLREIASGQRRRESAGEILTTTRVVHEAFVRLFGDGSHDLNDRTYFMAVAATAMRQVVIGNARQNAARRGSDQSAATFAEVESALAADAGSASATADALLALDRALERLHQRSERQSRIAECRFFGGMSSDETAAALGVSPNTVKHDWSMAQAWLHREIEQDLGSTPARDARPDEWRELELRWASVSELPSGEREAFLASQAVDPGVREELESLLARAPSAEAFFDRLSLAVPRQGDAMRVEHDESTGSSDVAGEADAAIFGADPLAGTTVAHYEIVARLGQGGMGVVYRASDLRLRRTVALKLLRANTPNDPRAKERLLVEARAAAALDHQNICTIFEVGETADGLPYIAMPFYPGETLDLVMQRGPVPLGTAIDYATQVARGLGAAHERGIIHRDVKPANIIVTPDGVVKLLDFGIARTPDVVVSREGVTPGTIGYMSPEQVASRPLDQRTDLWSLGVVLYEMCTGERPFRGESAGAVLYAILQASPAPVSAMRPELAGDIDAILARLLEKDANLRYENADRLISDLSELSNARPAAPQSVARVVAAEPIAVAPQPDGTATTAGLHTRRRQWLRATSYGVAALALGAGIASWQWGRRPAGGSALRSERPPTIALPGARPSTPADSNRAPFVVPSSRRVAAKDLYDRGNNDVLFRTDSGRQLSRDLLRQAIAMDSTYAPPHAVLAVMDVAYAPGSRQGIDQSRALATTAIRLDPQLPEGHAALGRVLMFDYHFAEAEIHLKQAVELDPKTRTREFLILLYTIMDRPADVLEQAELFVRHLPTLPSAVAELARALALNGRCDEALVHLESLQQMRPPPARTGNLAAQCYAVRKEWPKAIATMRQFSVTNRPALPYLGYMLARGGYADSARAIRDTLLADQKRGRATTWGLAVIHAGLRDTDRAFYWLDKAYEDRTLRADIMGPLFDDLHRDERFDRLRARLGIQKR